jgi:hypothetical protein
MRWMGFYDEMEMRRANEEAGNQEMGELLHGGQDTHGEQNGGVGIENCSSPSGEGWLWETRFKKQGMFGV